MIAKRTLLLFTAFVDYLGIGIVYPIFALLLFDHSLEFVPFNTSDTLRGFYLGVLLALMPLTQFFFSSWLGRLSDLYGTKPLFLLTLSLGLVGYGLALLAIEKESLSALFLYRALVGIGAANAAIIQAALVKTSSEGKSSSKSFSLFNMVMGVGYTVGPFLGGFLSEPNALFEGSIFFVFTFGALLTGSNLLLMALFYKEKERVKIGEVLTKGVRSLIWENTVSEKSRELKALFICSFIFSFGWSFFFEFVPVFLIGQYNFTSSDIGNFYGFSGALYAISCAFLIHPLLKKFSFQRVLFFAFFISGIYSFVFLLIQNPVFIWYSTPFLIYLIALIYPTTSIMVSTSTKSEHQGEALGSLLATQSLAFAISPLLSGFLVGIYHQMPILLGGVSFLIAGVVFGFSYFRRVQSL